MEFVPDQTEWAVTPISRQGASAPKHVAISSERVVKDAYSLDCKIKTAFAGTGRLSRFLAISSGVWAPKW